MSESEVFVDYRTKFLCDVLRRHGITAVDSIADFGSGDGRILGKLANRLNAARAIGVDIRAELDQSTDVVSYERTNFFDFTPDEPCDLVTSIQVFEHIYDPWLAKYFDAMKRACRTTGTLLISTPNRWRPSNIIRAATFRKPFMMNANPGVPPEEFLGHHRECSYREMTEIMQRHFPRPEWRFEIVRPAPRRIGTGLMSMVYWGINLMIYYPLWMAWRPACGSASHDHYVLIRRQKVVT